MLVCKVGHGHNTMHLFTGLLDPMNFHMVIHLQTVLMGGGVYVCRSGMGN